MLILSGYTVRCMRSITTESTIRELREYFSWWVILAKLVTDNGPSLCSDAMEEVLAKYGVLIQDITTQSIF